MLHTSTSVQAATSASDCWNNLVFDCVSVRPRLPSLVEYVEQPLTAGLRDRAACVRRVAVLGWAKLYNLQPNSEIGRVEGCLSCFCFPVLLFSDSFGVLTQLHLLVRKREVVWMCQSFSSTESNLVNETDTFKPVAFIRVIRQHSHKELFYQRLLQRRHREMHAHSEVRKQPRMTESLGGDQHLELFLYLKLLRLQK